MKKIYLLLTSLSTFAAFAQPANDDCSGAIPVQINSDYQCGTVVPGTLLGATASNVSDNGAGTPDDDVWFTFTATNTTHRFSMLNRVGNATDLVHEILVGTCAGLQSINISDPETSTVNNLIVGTTYYLRVFSYYANASANTTFNVCIGTPPPPPPAPANNDCSGAYSAQVNPDFSCGIVTAGTLYGATASNVPDNGAGTPDDDVWFTFTATNTTHRFSMLNRVGNTTDLVHEILVGTCNGLQSINISDPETSTVNNLVIGTTYYIRVFSYFANSAATTTFDVCIGTPPPPPANDDCDGAFEVVANPNTTCTNIASGTVTSATASNVPDNGAGTPNDDVWFYFTATSTSHNIALSNIQGSTTNMVFEVMTGICSQLSSLVISDPNSALVNGLTVGQTYLLRIFSNGSVAADVTFDVCITTPATLTNDDCFDAIGLTVNPTFDCTVVTPGSLAGATASNVSDNGAGTPDDDVWFSFVATNTTHRFSMLNRVGNATDLVHEILVGTCNGLQSINISDPETSTVNNLVVGTTYYVRVFSYYANSNANTTFDVCVGTPPPAPSNDECANAIAITTTGTLAESLVDGTVASATASANIPAPGCASYNGGDVWYTVTIPDSGNLTIETTASSTGITTFDSGIAVYAGICSQLSLVSCDDDGADTANFSRLVLTGRTPGEVLYVRVWEYNNDEFEPFSIGAFDASLSAPSFDADNLRVYPNPVNNILNLSYSTNMESVEVFNLVGQQVAAKSVNATSFELNVSDLPAGTYLVKVNAEGGSKTVKVLKN